MRRRDFAFGAALGMAGRFASAQTRRQPNIVFILTDNMGYADLGSYGAKDIRSPNVDSIAAAGIKFNQFYANAPECSPTRCALMTGRYQQRVGGFECALGNGNTGRNEEAVWLQKRGDMGLPPTEPTLPRILKNHGYETAGFGKWHLGYPEKFWPLNHGFDEYFGFLGGGADYYAHTETNEGAGKSFLIHNDKLVQRKGYLTDLFADAAIEWLEKRRNPFFLYIPFNAPATPVQDPDANPDGPVPIAARSDRKAYGKALERMDKRVGDVLATLDRMKVADNTLVIFMNDNGGDTNGPLRGKIGEAWEGGIRVAAMARWPGVIPAGQVTDQVGIGMDWLPTLAAATGAPLPKGRKLDGMSLLETLKGKQPPVARNLYWRLQRGERLHKATRQGDMKYTYAAGTEGVFDLGKDLGERNNLMSSMPDVTKDLKAKFAAWEKEVAAPRTAEFRKGSA